MRSNGDSEIFTFISDDKLGNDRHLPSYYSGNFTYMRGMMWNKTRVTVREGNPSLLARELKVLSSLSHPQLLLLMGYNYNLNHQQVRRLLFEPVVAGSLFICLHGEDCLLDLKDIDRIDILLSVTDGLWFLHQQGLVHGSVSSYAVHAVNKGTYKLGMFERMARNGCITSWSAD